MTTATWIVLFICCFVSPMTTMLILNGEKKKKENQKRIKRREPKMNKVNRYFEKLKKETNALKLFVPVFIGMTAILEILSPAVLYVIKVFWKHQAYDFPNPLYGLVVSCILSTAIALAISIDHRKGQMKLAEN